MPPLTPTAAWGRYNNIGQTSSDIANEERAYGHHYLFFTDQLHLRGSQGPTHLATNVNALICSEPARVARGTTFSIGVNCKDTSGMLPYPGDPTKSTFAAVRDGFYDSDIQAWADAMIAFRPNVYELQCLFHLEPDAKNQPGDFGTGPEYVAAFNRAYGIFSDAGVQAAGIKVGCDLTGGAWRPDPSVALTYIPDVYDVCSADFYPASGTIWPDKTLGSNTQGLGNFFDHAASVHPTNPVQVRSVSPKTLNDADAASWFTDANNTLLTIPSLLGVGWDLNNQFLDILTGTEADGNYNGVPLTKQAFHDMAVPWTEDRIGSIVPLAANIDLAGWAALA